MMTTKKLLGNRWMSTMTAVAYLAVGAGAAHAAVLSTSAPNYSLTSFGSTSASDGEQECTPFTLAATSTITQVSFWGDYFDGLPATDSFTVSLYSGGNPPGTTALSTQVVTNLTRVDTGLMGARGLETYFYTATLATPLQVTGGTNYAIAVLNSLTTWDWQLGAAGANYFRFGADGTTWSTSGTPAQDSLQLIGTAVPEPSSVVLLGVAGAVAVVAWRRRRVARA